MFPPGRARLWTRPEPTGSNATKTTGVVGGHRRTLGDEHVHFEVDQFGDETWQPVGVTVCISVFDDDVLLLDIAKPSESLSQPFDRCGVRTERAKE